MRFSYFERLFWLVFSLVLLGVMAGGVTQGNNKGILLFAATLFLFCARIFLGHGGKVVTPLGVWMVMTALVSGYAAVVGVDDYRVSDTSIMLAQALIFVQAVGIAIFSWGGTDYRIPEMGAWNSSRRTVVVFCWVLLMVSLLLVGSPGIGQIIAESIGFAAIVVMVLALCSNIDLRFFSFSTVLILLAFLFYVVFLHSGSGRLRVAALAFAILMVLTLRFRTWVLKWATVAGVPIGLSFFAWYRIQFIESTVGSAEGRTGLESLTDPFITFSYFVDLNLNDMFTFAGFKNLLTPISFLLPSGWEVPEAFGYQIVEVWRPESYGSGYSAAATAAGEWYWMGGIMAVFLSIPFLGILVRWLGVFYSKVILGFETSAVKTGVLLIVILLGSSLGDLVWGGIHTYIYRSVVRIFAVIFIIGIVAITSGIWSKRNNPSKLNRYQEAL